jgi:hypothetical protein
VSQALRLPFDRYQRNRLVSDVLAQLRTHAAAQSVLELGGSVGGLADFLPQDHVISVDPASAGGRSGGVRASPLALPFRDRSIDVVCAIDSLDQVPADQRQQFVRECARVARCHVLLAGPYDSPKVRHAEVLLRRFLKEKLGVTHAPLELHRTQGLPDKGATENLLLDLGARVASVGHADLERWFALRLVEFYLQDDPGLARLAEPIFEFYNRNLYASDQGPAVYRQCLVASVSGRALPPLDELFPAAVMPEGSVEGLSELLKALVGFDTERRRWRRERAALELSIEGLQRDLESQGTTHPARPKTPAPTAPSAPAPVLPAPVAAQSAAPAAAPSAGPDTQAQAGQPAPAESLRAAKIKIEQLGAELRYVKEREAEERSSRLAIEQELKQQREQARQADHSRAASAAELEGLRQAVQQAEAAAAAAKGLQQKQAAELAKLQGEHRPLEIRLQQVTAELSFIKEREQEERSSRQAIEGDFKQHREQLRKLSAERSALAAREAELGSKLDEARSEAQRLQNEIVGVRSELRRVRELLDTERGQAKAQQSRLEGELKHEREVLQRTDQEARRLHAAHQAAEQRLAEQRSGTQDQSRDLERRTLELAGAELRVIELTSERDILVKEVRTLREEHLRMQEQLMLQGARCQQLEERIQAIDAQEYQWNEEREGFNQTVAEVLADLQQHREKLVELRGERDRCLSSIATLEREQEHLRALLEAAMRERDQVAGAREARQADSQRKTA